MTNEIKGIPEVTNKPNNNKTIACVVMVTLGLVFVLYANVASSKKSVVSYNIHEQAPVLSFNEAKPLNLVTTPDINANNNTTAYEQPVALDGDMFEKPKKETEQNIDPDKLIEFKKMMDSISEQQMREIVKRRSAKTLIYTNSKSINQASNDANKPAKSFIEEVDKTTPKVEAVHTTNLSTSILEGTIIHATLETAVNSDLPGSMRAVINRPVYSADGINKLLNPGDRLVMKYTSKVSQGAARIFAVGSRIIKADGISINLGSEVASPLGMVGVGADSVDTHFFQRFGEASLLAVLSASAATMNVSDEEQFNSLSMYRSGIADSFTDSARDSLKQHTNLAPTLRVGQGKEITVFVAKDINFDKVYSELL